MRKRKKEISSNLEIMRIRDYDENLEAFLMADKGYMNFYEVKAEDKKGKKESELEKDMIVWAKFYRIYENDIKFLSINLPISTYKQRKNLEYQLSKTTDVVRHKWIQRQIKELEKLEDIIMRREFFLFFYGKTKASYIKNKEAIEIALKGKIREIPSDKKLAILKKINNMNTSIIRDYDWENEYERVEADE